MNPMLKILLPLAVQFTACNQPDKKVVVNTVNTTADSNKPVAINEIDTAKILIAGERAGKIILNSSAENLEGLIGKADLSDAAMGKAWQTWYGSSDTAAQRTELNIYTAYSDKKMVKHTVQQIRVTSPFFTTTTGIHVNSKLREITTAYPQATKAATFRSQQKSVLLYDDQPGGIAFEVQAADSVCKGIIIHQKGKKVTDIYIMLHPDIQVYK